jgi:hypothetical protein
MSNPSKRPSCRGLAVARVACALVGMAALVDASSAFAQPAAPASGYDSSWYVSDFWSGEYPPGFSVTRPETAVRARRAMDKAAARDVECRIPYLAVIHPWNKRRIATSQLRFVSASKIVHLVAKEAFVFQGVDARTKVPIKKGDTVDYIRNDAEGSFEVRIAGKQYTAGQDLFDHMEKVADDQFAEEDWVALTCVGGTRAWIFLADLGLDSDDPKVQAPGISGVGPGQTGYGKARDLTVAEARELEAARQKDSKAPPK